MQQNFLINTGSSSFICPQNCGPGFISDINVHIFYFLGVVHLASTESTGGSTTGDDEESSDQQPSLDRVLLETRRNTHQNESIANSYRQAQEKLGFSDADTSNNENQNGANVFTENSTGSGTSSTAAAGGQSGACSSLYPPSLPASFPSQSTRSSKHRYEYCLRKIESV